MSNQRKVIGTLNISINLDKIPAEERESNVDTIYLGNGWYNVKVDKAPF